MAKIIPDRDIEPVLSAAKYWINNCLINDESVFGQAALWNSKNIEKVRAAFVDHPDFGDDDFVTKLVNQMKQSDELAQKLMSEILWALLLFPSNIKASTKRRQIKLIWSLSNTELADSNPMLSDEVLRGIGSGGPAFNNYRPDELEFLIGITQNLKSLSVKTRQDIFSNYDRFCEWMEDVPQQGNRQYRHMLRYFAFPEQVERMSSNRDRRNILEAYNVASSILLRDWSDKELDMGLRALRDQLEKTYPSQILDFYFSPLRERWTNEQVVKTEKGDVTVVVPIDDEEEGDSGNSIDEGSERARQSFVVQARLSEIGAILDYKIWLPRNDRRRVESLIKEEYRAFLCDELPLSYDTVTLKTIEQIDVIWLKGRSIVRAFEVEHSTAVYSGLLRMADLLAMQPNMDIRLHIVAPEERRDKVFYEMRRPVFTLLGRGPLTKSCTFLAYDGVLAIREMNHLSYMSDRIIEQYEERAPQNTE